MLRSPQSARIVGGALAFGLFYWVLDGVLNYFYFHSNLRFLIFEMPESLLDALLLKIPPYALFTRAFFLFMCVAGGVMAALAFHRQATTRDALRESETKFAKVFRASPQAIIISRLSDGTILEVNDIGARLLGYAREELIGRRSLDLGLVRAEDRKRSMELLSTQGSFQDIEARFFTKSGEERVGLFAGDMIRIGGEQCIIQVVNDITGRKRAEQTLARNEATLQSIFRAAPIGIGMVVNRTFTWVNDRLEQMLGYSSDELIGQNTRMMYKSLEEYERIGRENYAEIVEHEAGATETRLRRKDGGVIDVLLSLSPIDPGDHSVGVTFTVLDITERKQAAETLSEHSRALQTLNRIALDISAELDMPTLLRRVMERAVDLLNADAGGGLFLYEPETESLRLAAGIGVDAAFLGVALKPGEGLAGDVFLSGQPQCVEDYKHWEKRAPSYAGADLARVLEVPLRWQDQVIGVLGINRAGDRPPFGPNDVWLAEMFAAQAAVAIKNAQLYQQLAHYSENLAQAVNERTAELQRVKERVEAILNNSPDAILLARADGKIELFNQAFSDLFGYQEEDVFARPPTMLAEPGRAEAFDAMLRAALERGEGGRMEIVALRHDGTTFDADVAVACIKADDAVVNLVCSFRDISALKEVERMKDAFVSSVSHELRTPITSLKLYHDLLARNPGKLAVYMARLERETQRLSRIVEDLLQLSRLDQGRAALELRPVNLNALANQYVIDRKPLAEQHQLTLTLDDQPDLPLVQADEGLIGQALSILLTNAINYTPSGGHVTVRTQARQCADGRWIGVSVIDDGLGIAPDECPRLFERFFRGKAALESGTPGTGLGLALAKEIIERHHGEIEVISDGVPGKGATFNAWLPVTS